MKAVGFLTGAVVAGIAVFAFNQWRNVTDTDRMLTALSDHCLPYAQTGDAPFDGMGRSIGVYDDVDIDAALEDGGALLIFDNRFVAQWGVVPATDAAPVAVRLCRVSPTFANAGDTGFAVPDEGLIQTITSAIAPNGELVTGYESVPNGPTTMGWSEPDSSDTEGLRVVIVAGGGVLSYLIVANDIP